MENSTKSANILVLRGTCDARSHQDHLPPVVPTLLIVNIVINFILACTTVISNIFILISLRRTFRVHAASKALDLLQFGHVWSGRWHLCTASVRYTPGGGTRGANGSLQAGRKYHRCCWCNHCRRLAPDSVGHQRRSSARHTSQNALQRGRNCQPKTDRCAHLLVHQYLSRSQILFQYGFLQYVSGCWHSFLYLCLVNFISHYFSPFEDPSKPNPELQPWLNFKFLVQYKALQEIGVHCTVGLFVSSWLLCSLYTIPCRALVRWGQCYKPCGSLVYGDTFIPELCA